MKHLHSSIAFLCAVSLMGCGGGTGKTEQGMDSQTAEQYAAVSQTAQQTQQLLDDLQTDCRHGRTLSAKQITSLCALNEQLVFDYNPATQDSAANAQCKNLSRQIDDLHNSVNELVETQTPNIFVSVHRKPQELLETTQNYPIYLERGDRLLYHIETEKPADVRIYNADSHQLLKTYTGKTLVRDSVNISFSAIYLVQVTPKTRQYAGIKIGYKTQDVSRLAGTKQVRVDSVDAQKGDFLAAPIRGIKMTNLFDDPRKFTLRGQLKAAFSGSYRAIVALQVPAGATDVLYSLRISTNEGNKSSDGDFYDDMETSYRRIKVLGLPIYESHRGSGLIATLLGENVPPREEDAYINMYVFYNAAQAKKFQDGTEPSKLSYSVDYSTMGTQSCNGRIPAKGYKTIYLGFLNERMRYNNYVWLEALSAVPHTEYIKPVFKAR
mgnify:FL=1